MKYTDDEYAVKGMLSKRYIPFDDFSGYKKNSKENVYFYVPNSLTTPKVSLQYLTLDEYLKVALYNVTSKYKLSEVTLKIPSNWYEFKGGDNKEFRETWNHYYPSVSVRGHLKNDDDIVNFIKMWDEDRGTPVYGWQKHSGYDLNFFDRYNETCQTLYFYIDNVLVGYSVLHNYKDNIWTYIIRKADLKYRNLTLFVDMFSFWNIDNINEIRINFGASSGGVLKYKKKFPIDKIEDRYFVKINNE